MAEAPQPKAFHPQKFALWLAMASMVMLFAALTSAYIVREGQGNWVYFSLPYIFWLNTGIIILSSITMQWAVRSYKNYHYSTYRTAIIATFILGTLFLAGQYIGWLQLDAGGIHLNGNPSGSFVYVISGLHAAHILGGVIILFFAALRAFYKKFNPNRLDRVQMTAMYWHFVDALWIYLFVFFQITLA